MRRIEAPTISFSENGEPFSTSFGDIYFSPADGLAETRTVFLEGNGLPQAWQGRDRFTIAETGFGTGLNFLSVCQLLADQPGQCRHLHFISVERFPLSRDQLAQALAPWRAHFGTAVDRLIAVYPLRIPGFHRIWFSDHVTLTLIFDDAAKGLHDLDATVDAWFLDGFSPGKNPLMWQPDLYTHMARLSHMGTTIASFTAAGDVRRGLSDAGFVIERQKGYGHKRHRITGRFNVTKPPSLVVTPRRVAIIGTGLAGTTMAHALQRHGIACTLFDRNAGPGQNASSNRLGLVNPKIDLGHDAVNDLGQSLYSFALHRLQDQPQVCDVRKTGAFHPASDDTKRKRQTKMRTQLDWLPDHLRTLTQTATTDTVGLTVPHDGLLFPDSVTVNTGQLVTHLLDGLTVQWQTPLTDYHDLLSSHDAVIIASSEAAQQLCPSLAEFLQPMRGQVTFVDAPAGHALHMPIVAGHYVAPLSPDVWVTGASFQRNRTDTCCDPADDRDNLLALQTLLPDLPIADLTVRDHWAQVRYTTPDRRPVLGAWADGVYVAAGLGSHGLQYGFLLAEILASRLTGAPMPVGRSVLGLLDLHRYTPTLP